LPDFNLNNSQIFLKWVLGVINTISLNTHKYGKSMKIHKRFTKFRKPQNSLKISQAFKKLLTARVKTKVREKSENFVTLDQNCY
jgi:hypothetical protein